jgi:hypothetical protein
MAVNVPSDTSLVTSHSAQVSYLALGTTYYYQVQSKDASGKPTNSAQQSFTTLWDSNRLLASVFPRTSKALPRGLVIYIPRSSCQFSLEGPTREPIYLKYLCSK